MAIVKLRRLNTNNWFKRTKQEPYSPRFVNEIIDKINEVTDELLRVAPTGYSKKELVFTCDSELVSTNSGLLVVGKTYVIGQLFDDGLGNYDDFSNVGFISEGTPFVATGTTPTVWTNGTPVHNLTDLPTLNVLDSNFENPITIGFWNDSGIIRPSLISMGEFTNNIMQLGANLFSVYIDANTINLNSIVPFGQPAGLMFY